MNKRIKELAEQAGFVDYTVHNRLESKETVLENFARLIIEECQQAVSDTYEPVREDGEMMIDDYWKGYVSCGTDAFCEIRIRFWEEEDE